MKLSVLLQSLAACASLAFAATAAAQIATNRGPVRIIVGYPAGGSADAIARSMSERMAAEIGTTVVVENRTGAGGQIAADYVRAAAPDGLTILLSNMHMMVTLPLTSKSVKYEPLKDFKAVGRIASFNEAISVPAALPAKDIKQWLDLARADQSKASYGVPSPGSLPQFMGYKMGTDTKTALLAAPYRGSAPLVQDLLGNQISAGITPIADVYPHMQAGKLRILAVNGTKRVPLIPDVPTLRELGMADFDNLEWVGFFVPPGTPPAIVAQLHTVLEKTLANKDVTAGMAKLGLAADISTPEELMRLVADDLARWAPIIKASGFTAE